MNDVDLLSEYVARGCQDSFSELVRRHINLVYGTATRQVRDPHLAQEISQKVFCALAQNAGSIRNPSALTAWLYRTTCQLATLHVRTEYRRIERERAAAAMNLTSNDKQDRWDEVEPLLDQALAALGDTDRLAILLRFFETKQMAEVGAMLGVSEAAAKMRIGRAIEKLRIFFVRRGVTCSTAGLFLLFDRHAGAAAPLRAVDAVLQAATMSSSCQATPPVSGIQNLANVVLQKVPAAASVVAIVAVIAVILNRSGPTGTPTTRRPQISTAAATNSVDLAEQSAEVRADQRSASTFRLTVLDAETALPLKGVQVTASNLGDRLGESVTDGTGACEVPRPTAAPNDFYFRLRARLDGYATMDVSWSRFQQNQISDVPAEYVLKMSRGSRVGGFVTDDREQPLAGVEVTLHGRSGPAGPPDRERAVLKDWGKESVVTDQAGHWAFDRLPSDWDNVHFIVSTPEYLRADYVTDANSEGLNGMNPIPKQDLLDERAVFALHRGVRVAGRVVDESGRPVAGASLVRNFDWHEAAARTMSAADGTYEILNATTGPLALTVQAPRFAPKVVRLTVNGPITDSTIVLARGSLLHGRVIDEDGNSIENAALDVARDENWRCEFQWTARTDANGRFLWDAAPEQPVALEVIKPGFQLNRVSLTAGDIENVVTLKRQIQPDTILVQGRVLDEERGQPIERFQILVAVDPASSAPPKDGRNGAFSVPINVSDQAQTAIIEIRAEGYEPARLTPALSSNPIPELTFKLRPASGWSGTVLLPNGEPAVDAEVGISSHAQALILGDRRFLFRQESIIRRTDPSGRFRFEPLPSERSSGRVIVAVHSQGYAEHDADRFASGLTLQLLPWGRIEGVLRSRGEPLANEQVYIMKRDWNPWTSAINLYPGQFAVRTDATGRFAFESVPPGDHQLGRTPHHALDTRLTVQLRPGETTRIQVGGDGQPVTGRIVIPGRDQGFDLGNSTGLLKRQQARPIDLPRVRRKDYPSDEAYERAAKGNAEACITYWRSAEGLEAWREQRSYGVKFEADGTFHADDVPPGEYTLRVTLNEVRAGSRVNETRAIGMPLSGSVGVPAGGQTKRDESVNVGIVTLNPE